MNKADNDASSKSIDSLLNYEVRLCESVCFYCPNAIIFQWNQLTNDVCFICLFMLFYFFCDFQTVKYFNNESFEVSKYDKYLKSKLNRDLYKH